MPLPEAAVQQQGEVLDQVRNPGFETENLPSPKGFDAPSVAPIAIPGTGAVATETGQFAEQGFSQSYLNGVLGAKGDYSPGKLPQYTASEVYSPRYRSILPGEDSEEVFAKAQPWYKKWGNAFTKMGATAAGTFWNTLTAIPDTVVSIKDGKPYDTAAGNAIDTWLKNLEDEFPNYYTRWEQEHPFMSALPFSGGFANFWGDKFFKNLGFTIGAIGGAVVQDLAVGAATEGLGEIPLIGAQIGKASLWLNKVFTGEDKVEKLLDLGRAAGRTSSQLVQLRGLAQAAEATKVANGTRFALNLYGSAASEAGFEAREGYNSTRQELLETFQRENGYSPTGKELEDIEKYARDAGNTRFGLNLTLLGISNAIQFDAFLKPFSAAKAGYRSALQKELEEGVGTIQLKKGSIDQFERAVPTGLAGKTWSAVRPIIPNILSEGVFEEGGQYAAQIGTENYYIRKYLYDKGLSTKQYQADQTPWDARSQVNNILHSMMEGMQAQFGTIEGQENMFLGALTGAITGGVLRFADREKSARTRGTILGLLNSQGVTGTIRQTYDNAVTAQRIAEDMREAVRSGDLFKYKNFQHEQFVRFVLSGAQAGRFDVRMEQLKLLRDMPDDQFKAAFGLDKSTENVRTVSEYVDALTRKAGQIKSTYDLIDKTFVNPYQRNRKSTTIEASVENEKYEQFEQWKGDLTYLASILPDVEDRLYGINKDVRDISQYVTNEQVAELTNPKSLRGLSANFRQQAASIQTGLDEGVSVNKEGDKKMATSLLRRADAIDDLLTKQDFNADKFQKVFGDLLNYNINGQSDDFKVEVPPQGLPQLINYGVDINRLNALKQSANEAFEKLSSREGFEKYFRDIERDQEKAAEAPQVPPRPTAQSGPVAELPAPAKPATVLSHQGQQRIFDQDTDYFVALEPGSNPEKVQIVGQSADGVQVRTADGIIKTVPVERFFQDDTFPEEVTKEVDGATSVDDIIPSQEDMDTKVGEAKKDISFGLFATTDPVYSNRTTPFNNFQRRHQNFLFNLGTSDPDLFNQDSKAKLRLIPVNAATAPQLGFPGDFITGGTDNADNSVIRAVYVVDNRIAAHQKERERNRIVNEIRTRPNLGIIASMLASDTTGGQQIIDFIFEQQAQGGGAMANLEQILGEDLINDVIAYKSAGIFFVNEHGEPLSRIGQPVDPNVAVFTTFASTDLQFGQEQRYTNKQNLDETALQDWWREQRKGLLKIATMGDTPMFNFTVSRGIPHVVNDDLQNNVLDVGLIREADLDKPVITIPTAGNVAAQGAFDEAGAGISAAREGINMPKGIPLLSFGLNLVFLNSRTLSPQEAENLFDILRIISDRSAKVDKAPLFRYLNKIVYLANAKKNIQPTAESIMIDGDMLQLGTSESRIHMDPQSLDEAKQRILDFFVNIHHATNNTELNRIKNNPKATDLEFRELQVVDGQVSVKQTWKNYNHYLLSNKNPDGKRRVGAPLSTNIAIPQEGEVPIIQKYAVLKGLEFDVKSVQRPEQPKPVPPPAPVIEQKDKQQGVKQQPADSRASDIERRRQEELQAAFGTNVDLIASGRIPVIERQPISNFNAERARALVQQYQDINARYDAEIAALSKKETPASTAATGPLDYIEVNLGNGPVKLGFTNVIRDNKGNITDLTPVGKIDANGAVTAFKNPPAVKEIILDELRKSQATNDTTNTPDDSFWDDPNFKPKDDPQYREFSPEFVSYKTDELTKEFQQAREMLGDDQLLQKVKHVLKTTSGGLAYGAFADNVIYVWEGAKVGTTYHEVFEKVYNTFLTGKQQQDLYEEFVSRKGAFTLPSGRSMNFSDATMFQAKEQIAEEFTEFVLSGKLPEHKRQRSFFQRLMDFIHRIIFGDPSRVNLLFKKINKGYYRNYATSLNFNPGPHYREVEIQGFSQALIQDTMQGMTVEMLLEAFKEGSDIITQLEENQGQAARDIYDRLRNRLEFYFENTSGADTLAAEMKAKRDRLSSADDKEAIKAQYLSIKNEWQRIKDNWDSFVRMHQRYLRVFNIEFEVNDEGNIAFANEDEGFNDNQNMAEYDRDILLIDAKNSASTRIKLLIATLADSEWIKEATVEAIGATRTGGIAIKRDASLLALPKQVQYAKLFNYLLHNTTGINGIYEIWEKLVDMTEDPQARKAIDANIKRLMNRLDFYNGFDGKNPNQAKLILSMENTLSKQKLGFSRQFVDFQRNTYYRTTVLNTKVDQVKDMWVAAIKGSSAVLSSPDNMFRFSKSVLNVPDNQQFLEKIGISISRAELGRLKGKDVAGFNEAVNVIRSVIEKAAQKGVAIPVVSSKVIDFNSRLNDLAEIYVTKLVGDDTQSQHPNLDNQQTSNFVLNNFASTVLNDANNSPTREAFLNKIGNQYLNDVFHRDSVLLNEIIFGEDGKHRREVKLEIVEGREAWNQNNKAAHKLTEAERQLYEINNNLNGVFYTLLPADAKMEWAIRTGTYLSASNFFADATSMGNEVTKFSNQMYKWLQTEVDLARDYENRQDIVALRGKLGDRIKGRSLRFFADILPKEIVNEIHEKAIDQGQPLDSVVTQGQMRGFMRQFAFEKARRTLDNLVDWKLINASSNGQNYWISGFDKAFMDNHMGGKTSYTEEELLRLLGFREMNYIMNNIEMHKFLFGDPAQYKDELKRIKSFLSGREASHVDTLSTPTGFNHWANSVLNMVGEVQLQPSDPGYQQHKNHLNTITLYDIEYESDAIDQIEEAIGKEKAKPYTKGNEADAQAYISATAYREAAYKAGGRFTAAQERQFQWEMAWERNDKAKEGKYTYANADLRRADLELLKTPADPNVDYPILKLIHSGIQYNNGVAVASLDKASWAPLFYRWVRGTNLEKLYNAMQRQGIDYARMESAHKVGIQSSSSADMYDSEGNINVLGLYRLKPEQVSFKHLGVQVEQRKKEKGQTEGSQARKMVTVDLMDGSVPIDFLKEYSSQADAISEWEKLTEDQKRQRSAIYAKVKRHDDALGALTQARVENTMRRLGIIQGPNGPVIEDKQRVSDFILSELERRELPRNLAYGLEIDPATGDFSQPLEANAQYSKIRSILYSVIESTIMRPKVNGGQKTLLSVSGWEKSNRIIKKTVNGKPVYTSGRLKFYTRADTGTEAMEVMLPYWFGKKLMEMGSGRTKEEVLTYLNSTQEGRKLLSGIGFRIPTQYMNSIDFFVVKDFLPEQMGDTIILPSEITAKAGSDFDIDKLNTYLRNFYVDNETGYPRLVEWKGSSEATKAYLSDLLDKGNVISRAEKEELDRIIAEETADLDQAGILLRVPGVANLFSDEQITRDFLGKYKDVLVNKLHIQALENEFFDSMEDLLRLPENYQRLIAPNDASQLKKRRTEIKDMKGQTQQEGSLGDYGKLLDSTFMVKERQAYMASKGLVAVAAVAGTFHSIAQKLKGGLVVADGSVVARFPHNEIGGNISFSGVNVAGSSEPISAIISQTVDGGVDVAKDKFLAEMGITSETAKNFLTFVRAGASDKWATRFLNQPAIQEYVKLKAIHDSVSQVNPRVKRLPQYRLRTMVNVKFGGMDFKKNRIKNKPSRYSIESMEHAIRKYASGEPLTYEEQTLQLMMLDDYLQWDSLGWEMFHYYQGYNWDTARLGDPNAIRLKELKYDKANQLKISKASQVMQDTFIGAMKSAVERLDQGLRSAINIQSGEAGKILDNLAADLFTQRGLSEDTRRALLLAAELSMVDFAVQTSSEVAGKSLNNYIQPLLLGEKPIAKYVEALKRVEDKRIAQNPFVAALMTIVDDRKGYPSLIRMQDRDYDTYTSNVWTDGFRELKDDATIISINRNEADDRMVSQIYKNLVAAIILENGSKRGANSISHLIPNETYGDFTRTPLKNIHLEGFYENNVLYRTSWGNSYLVPQLEREQIDPQNPEAGMAYTFLASPKLKEQLKLATGSEQTPLIVNVPAWKYESNKAIKTVDYVRDQNNQVTGTVIRLFVRVDVEDIYGSKIPLSVMKKRILFKEINAWGDGTDVQEYYETGRPSVLAERVKVSEVTDEDLIKALITIGLNPNVPAGPGNMEMVSKENDDPDVNENEGDQSPEPAEPPAQGDSVPTGVSEKGKTYMSQQEVDQIKAGTKVWADKVGVIEEGVYTATDGTKVEFRLVGNAQIRDNALQVTGRDPIDLSQFALNMGYDSWEDYKQRAPFSGHFISGKQKRNIYQVSVFGTPPKPTVERKATEEGLEADLKRAASEYLREDLENDPKYFWPVPREYWDQELTTEQENLYYKIPGTRITMENLERALEQNRAMGDQIGDKQNPDRSTITGIPDYYGDYIFVYLGGGSYTEYAGFGRILDQYRGETDPEVKAAVGELLKKYGLGKYIAETGSAETGDPNQLSLFQIDRFETFKNQLRRKDCD